MSPKIILGGLFIATLVMVFFMRPSGKALKHPATPSGIISFELASDSTATQNIINAWENDLSAEVNMIQEARKNIFLDFIFLLLYSSLLFAAAYFLGAGTILVKKAFAFIAVVAGVCDVIENLLMLRSLNGQISSLVSMSTFVFATIKFALIVLVILYLFWSIATNKAANRR
jgi:hypothetical protein